MKQWLRISTTALLVLAGLSAFSAQAAVTVALDENFDSLPLGSPYGELPSNDYTNNAYTLTPPSGWSVDNSNMPANAANMGMPEWFGWSFANKSFWIEVAGNQDRNLFTLGSGTVVVSDPDEYDDFDSPLGSVESGPYFESILVSPMINVSGRRGVVVSFASDFRPEDNQAGQVIIEVDGTAEVLVEYGPAVGTVDDGSSRNLALEFERTIDGASTVQFKWRIFNATNDWWWTIDNVKVIVHDGDLSDTDGDGLSDTQEGELGTDLNNPDSDGDDLTDGQEVNEYTTNPLNPDTDGDDLSDGLEVLTYASNPLNADTDDDGISDGDEALVHFTNPLRSDTDGDDVSDGEELTDSTDPLDVYSYSGAPVSTRFFSDNFDAYADDAAMATVGWTIQNTAEAVETATWTITNPGKRKNPPMWDGRPSGGKYIVSDSDKASGSNPAGSGASHDISTPSFSTSGASTVWLHADVTAQLNDNGEAVFDIDVSSDGGVTWANVLRRVAPIRSAEPLPSNTNADGYFGRLHVDLSALASDTANVQVRFRHFEPNDDWWVGIDNVEVDDQPELTAASTLVFEEDFDDYTLGAMSAVSKSTPANSGAETWSTADKGDRYQAGLVVARGVNRLMHPDAEGTAGAVKFAILDSDANGGLSEDEWLVTPVLNLSQYREVRLSWDSETVWASSTQQQVLVSVDGGQTYRPTPVFSYHLGAGADNGEEPFYAQRILNVDQAAGRSQVCFAFRYVGSNNWWWAVDNIRVTAQGTIDPAGDEDGDGITNGEEAVLGTDPFSDDTDGDGISDSDEVDGTNGYVTDPNQSDTDGDGISDSDEMDGTNGYVTNPTRSDTDYDGISDYDEVMGTNGQVTDPTVPDTAHLDMKTYSQIPVADIYGLTALLAMLAVMGVLMMRRQLVK